MNNILEGLNPMQKQAVLHKDGPLLILAGAGSGKTRVLTQRIAYMIENGVRPWNILAITFTNKAAREMKERVEKASPAGAEVWAATFHSTCVRILRRHGEMLGYQKGFTIFDTSDSEKLIKTILKEGNIDDKKFRPKSILSFISSRKNNGEAPDEVFAKAEAHNEKLYAAVYDEYERAMFKNNAFDFDDLILKTVELFTKFPQVLERYQERFLYIMVDEYQDTNAAQYNLVNLLAKKYRNLCVVGDDDQSIYAFRGADIRNILDFEKDYPEAKVIRLEQNYRSTANILNAANEVIKNNADRKGKTLWTDKGDGEAITYFRCGNDREEAAFIADNIKRLVNRGAFGYNDIAILYRNNSLSRVLGEGMVKASIPYVVVRGHSFYESLEIKDMLAYLKFIYNPASEIDLMRIINVPKRGIGDSTVEKIAARARSLGKSMYEIIDKIEDYPEFATRSKRLCEFRDLMNGLIEKSLVTPVSELIDDILWETGYLPQLQSEDDLTARNRVENLYELKNKAVEFEEENPDDPSLAAFLDEISLVSDTDALKSEEGAVALMTLHASKGLEFPVVFLACFEEGIFPSAAADMSTNLNELEEERRLCYVGITRAKEKLFLTCSESRMMMGQTSFNPPSRFLREIPLNCLDDLSFRNVNLGFAGLNGKIKTYKNTDEKTPYKVMSAKAGFANRAKAMAKTPSKISYKPGDKVRNLKYGIGTVTEVKQNGGDTILTINFNAGERNLYTNAVKPVK